MSFSTIQKFMKKHVKIFQKFQQIHLIELLMLKLFNYVTTDEEVLKDVTERFEILKCEGNKTESVDKIDKTKKQKIAVTINKESIVRKKNDTSEEVRAYTARSSLDCKTSKIFEAVTSVKQNLLTRKYLMMVLELNMLKLMSFLILL